ncbi:MAG: TRAM domain-containing protein, partial [Candidatus Diapherotrites archaeon]
SEKGKNNTIVGRTSNYKPVVIEKGELGKFQEIEITDAYPHWLKGKIIENQTENKQEIKEKIVIKC